jgi:hypothetical protein
VAAVATVICGDVVAQDTEPVEFVQEYQVPPDASCALTVVAPAGLIVNVTASMFAGFDEFSEYPTELTV